MVGRCPLPQDVYTLIPGAHEAREVILCGRKDFAGIMKVSDLKIGEITLDCPWGPKPITWAIKSKGLSLARGREMQKNEKSEPSQA